MKIFHTRLFALLSSAIIWFVFGILVISPLPTHWSSLLVIFLLLLGGIVTSLFYFGLELSYQRGKIGKIMPLVGIVALAIILSLIIIIPHPRNDIKAMLVILFCMTGISVGFLYVLFRSRQCIQILRKEKLGIIKLDNNQAVKAIFNEVVAGIFVILAGGFLLYNFMTSKTFASVLNAYKISC